jgi:hypothetical protein
MPGSCGHRNKALKAPSGTVRVSCQALEQSWPEEECVALHACEIARLRRLLGVDSDYDDDLQL